MSDNNDDGSAARSMVDLAGTILGQAMTKTLDRGVTKPRDIAWAFTLFVLDDAKRELGPDLSDEVNNILGVLRDYKVRNG